MEYFNIQDGDFNTVKLCKYKVPSVQSIGKEYQRLNKVSKGKKVISPLLLQE